MDISTLRRSAAAQTIKDVLAPILEREQDKLLARLDQAVAELEPLLDIRAELRVIRNLKKQIDLVISVGESADS